MDLTQNKNSESFFGNNNLNPIAIDIPAADGDLPLSIQSDDLNQQFIDNSSKLILTSSQQSTNNIPSMQSGNRKSLFKPMDSDLKRRINQITSKSEAFYFDNEIQFDMSDSPFYKVHIARIEKRVENTRTFLKRFGKKLQEFVKSSEIFSQQLDNLSNEITMNLPLIENSKEIFSMFSYTADFFKNLVSFLGVLQFNLSSRVIDPLNTDLMKNLDVFKELKRKMTKADENFEAIEMKNTYKKKDPLQKDKENNEQLQNLHRQGEEQLLTAKYELTEYINRLQFETNLEMSYGVCAVLQSFNTFSEQQHLESTMLQSYLELFQAPLKRKQLYLTEMNQQMKTLKDNILPINNLSDIQPTWSAFYGEYLLAKSKKSKQFKRSYFQIDKGKFYEVKEDQKQNSIHRTPLCTLALLNFNDQPDCEFANAFELMSPQMQESLLFIAPSQQSLKQWKAAIQTGIEKYLVLGHGSLVSSEKTISSNYYLQGMQTFQMRQREESIQNELNFSITANNQCADCGKQQPTWISLNLCVVICLECSGIHRKLGTNISKIRSLKLDNINDEIVEFFLENDNNTMNAMWEKNLLINDTNNIDNSQLKPTADSPNEIKEKWIKDKYVDNKFMDQHNGENPVQLLCSAINKKNLTDIVGIVCLKQLALERLYQINKLPQTFLHYAVSKAESGQTIEQSMKVIALLIQLGSDINAKDGQNQTPIDIAKQSQKLDSIYQYLLTKE